jgi:hypothetical protein
MSEELNADSTAVDREFYDFYRTQRGYHPKTTMQPALATNTKFMNFHPFADRELIAPRPLLFITCDRRSTPACVDRGVHEEFVEDGHVSPWCGSNWLSSLWEAGLFGAWFDGGNRRVGQERYTRPETKRKR